MTIILFLIDTSGSMNQRTHFGARPTLLDVAKDAIEKFLKLRQRDSACRGDRYMLLTYEEPPFNVKAGWKESHAAFMNELKNLQANCLSTLGSSLKNAFDLLNINRMQTGIDTYGQGRCPYFLEPAMIVVITDGGKLSTTAGVQQELNLPMNSSVPGSELTKEPFRWDQRLFALVLRLTGTYNSPNDNIPTMGPHFSVPSDDSPINAMCEVTGGRSFCVTSQRMLMASLDQLVQKIHSGVVINFVKEGPEPPIIIPDEEQSSCDSNSNGNSNGTTMSENGKDKTSWHNIRQLIYVQRSAQKGYSVGHWPIPESFWPDLNSPSLPPRTAHPVVKFTCTNADPLIIDNLPFDKYELEPSPLTHYILSRKQPSVAWQVFISGSHKSTDLGLPFGYLKASTSLTCVNLFVLPYNYDKLLPFLTDLFTSLQGKPNRDWKLKFEDYYLKTIPLYYVAPLKRALQRMGSPPNMIADTMENCLSYPVLSYLKRVKNSAKAEYDKLVASVSSMKQPPIPEGIRLINVSSSLKKLKEFDISMSNPYFSQRFAHLKSEFNEFPGFIVRFRDKPIYDSRTQCYRNPYDISRHELLDQVARMRVNFLQHDTSHIKYQDDDQLHSLPISQMGNYQEYLKRMPTPLRELESTPTRQHMFGNPFKVDKNKQMMMIDEADIDLMGGNNGGSSPMRVNKRSMEGMSGPKSKRRPGPLPREFIPSRSPPYSIPTPPPSPNPLSNSSPSSSPTSSSLSSNDTIKKMIPRKETLPVNVIINSEQSKTPAQHQTPVLAAALTSPSSTSSTTLSETSEILDKRSGNKSEVQSINLIHNNNDCANHSNHSNDLQTIKEKIATEVNVNNDVPPDLTTSSSEKFNSETNDHSKNNNVAPIVTLNGNMKTLNSCDSSSPSSPSPPPSLHTNHNHNGTEESALHNNINNNSNSSNNNKRYHLTLEELEMRRYLFKLVKKPGMNFDELFAELNRFTGSRRDLYVQEVIKEAKRFKRKHLVDKLHQVFIRS